MQRSPPRLKRVLPGDTDAATKGDPVARANASDGETNSVAIKTMSATMMIVTQFLPIHVITVAGAAQSRTLLESIGSAAAYSVGIIR